MCSPMYELDFDKYQNSNMVNGQWQFKKMPDPIFIFKQHTQAAYFQVNFTVAIHDITKKYTL